MKTLFCTSCVILVTSKSLIVEPSIDKIIRHGTKKIIVYQRSFENDLSQKAVVTVKNKNIAVHTTQNSVSMVFSDD